MNITEADAVTRVLRHVKDAGYPIVLAKDLQYLAGRTHKALGAGMQPKDFETNAQEATA